MVNQYNLFRLTLPSKSPSMHLFSQSPGEMLKKILLSQAGAIVRAGTLWVIANAADIGDDVVYFKFGRAMRKAGEKFDVDQWMFVKTEMDIANCAECIFDAKAQVLAIEKAADCPSPYTLSKYIGKVIKRFIEDGEHTLFSAEEVAYIKSRDCVIGEVSDPVDFINDILNAFRVMECKMYISRTNPFDYDDLLQRPVGQLMDMSGADIGYTVIKTTRETLQADKIVDVAKASAAAGNDVVAKMQRSEASLPERIHLQSKTSCARIDVESGSGHDWLLSLVRTIRAKYKSIRGVGDV